MGHELDSDPDLDVSQLPLLLHAFESLSIAACFKTYLRGLEGSQVRSGIYVPQDKTLWKIDLSLVCHLSQAARPGYLIPCAVGQSCLWWYSCCQDRGLCFSELALFIAVLGQGGHGLKIPREFMTELAVASLTRISCKKVKEA